MALVWENLILLQASVTLMMTGVIWMVQLVIYPIFTHYRGAELERLHVIYTPKISLIVIPLMFSELGLALLGLYLFPSLTELFLFLPVLGVWAITFFVSVPLHQLISDSQESEATLKLVKTNWLRTFLWSFRGVFLLYFLFMGQ